MSRAALSRRQKMAKTVGGVSAGDLGADSLDTVEREMGVEEAEALGIEILDADAKKIVTQSYAECRRVAREAASNFYYAFYMLPQSKRDALCALYAFMRLGG